jgi:predicted nuclease of predicted toxin-antitoxin system
VKFLVDANLPPDLARWIGDLGHEATYVDDVLARAPALDDAVWRYAQAHSLTIISKDSDFIDLSGRNDGPQVVWVRCGNLKLAVFRNWFGQRAAEMLELVEQGERIIELR